MFKGIGFDTFRASYPYPKTAQSLRYFCSVIDINNFKELVFDLISSNNGGGLSPDEFIKYTNKASIARFNELYGKPETIRYDKPTPRVGYGMSQMIDVALIPFLTSTTVSITSGVGTLPSDVKHIDYIEANGRPVVRIPSDRWLNAKNSKLDEPTAEFPIYTRKNLLSIEVAPSTITSVKVQYLKLPTDAVWNFTLVSGRPVYDSSGSVHLEWDKSEEMNLAMKVLSYAGITIGDNGLIQYGEGQKQQGN